MIHTNFDQKLIELVKRTPNAIPWKLDMAVNVNHTVSTSANTIVLPISKHFKSYHSDQTDNIYAKHR